MRPRTIVLGLVAVVVLVGGILLSIADQFFVDLLWFRALRYGSAFATTLQAPVVIFAAVRLFAFAAMAVSGLAAVALSRDRERLRVVRRPGEGAEVNLPELIRTLGDRVPWRAIVIVASAVLAIFVAQGEAASWDVYLKALYHVPFGVKESAFGHDVGFYVFALPLLEELRDAVLLVIFLAGAVAAAVYWSRGALDFRETPPRIAPAVAAHASVLLGLFFVQRAFGFWLARFNLLLHTNGVVFGLRYVDAILWQPGLWLLVVLALLAAVVCFTNLSERGLARLVVAAIISFGPSLLLNFAQPVIWPFFVQPPHLPLPPP